MNNLESNSITLRIKGLSDRLKYLKEMESLRTSTQFILDIYGLVGKDATTNPNLAVFREGQRSVIDWMLADSSFLQRDLKTQIESLEKDLKEGKTHIGPPRDETEYGVPLNYDA